MTDHQEQPDLEQFAAFQREKAKLDKLRAEMESASAEDLAAFRAWKESTSATPPAPRGRGRGGAASGSGEVKMSIADQIIAMADSQYEFGSSEAGDLYAVPKHGPRIARLLRGGRISLRAELARAYYKLQGKAASSSALADAMLAIEGRAQAEDPVPLHLRVAPLGKRPEHGLVLDLGRADGMVVTITREGWSVAPAAEGQPLFRRSQLTQPLPVPARGGSLKELRKLLNVTDESWPLMVSWLVSGIVPGIPHPLLFLTGEQGTAKTSATKMLVQLIDPSAAPARSTPKDPDDWATAAVGSWVVGLDNLSRIPEWLSDAMCRAATGDANVKRTLYSDSDVTVQEFRRVLIVNGIDVGTLRGDLADRMIPVHLDRITQRRTETALWEAYHEAHPRILGALLDLLVQVLGKLPAIRERADRGEIPLPRMADYGLIMAALDEVYGVPEKSILRDYLQQRTELAEEVVESNQVATQLLVLMKRMPTRPEDGARIWDGTTAELLDELTSQVGMTNDKWPRTPGALSGRINRVASDLDKLGVDIARSKSNGKRSLYITYIPKAEPAAPPQQPDPVQEAIPA
ncbi:ATP-binding protein [Streptomyces sp. NPDC048663]|uniref:ATP-binding protein n=1 Tax=Streptomyces sp. NPDC048663 TaxID=3155638 RepID=UPI00341955C2